MDSFGMGFPHHPPVPDLPPNDSFDWSLPVLSRADIGTFTGMDLSLDLPMDSIDDLNTAILHEPAEHSLDTNTYTSFLEEDYQGDQHDPAQVVASAAHSNGNDARQSSHYVTITGPDQSSTTLMPLNDSTISAPDVGAAIRRPKSAPIECGDHYIFAANWPPPSPVKCSYGKRNDVYPPSDAPLHVWVQAYALRWATWAASIDDPVRREQVLDKVTGRMRAAWETAIKEGYYTRPKDMPAVALNEEEDHQYQNKRSRKRALSFGRLPAGLAGESHDRLGITNAELARYNLTMAQIDKRVKDGAFEEGERRMAQVLESLPEGQDQIVVRDWSIASAPTVADRNVLMYCFFVVQESRKDLQKLRALLSKFNKDMQVKNTEKRINLQAQREAQHMALATEITLQEPPTVETDVEGEEEQSEPESIEVVETSQNVEQMDLTVDDEARSTVTIPDIGREVLAVSSDREAVEVIGRYLSLSQTLLTAFHAQDSVVEKMRMAIMRLYRECSRLQDEGNQLERMHVKVIRQEIASTLEGNNVPLTWPSNEEIIAFIPAHGINGSTLMSHFGSRIDGRQEAFKHQVFQIADVDRNFKVFRRGSLQQNSGPGINPRFNNPSMRQSEFNKSYSLTPPAASYNPSAAVHQFQQSRFVPGHFSTQAPMYHNATNGPHFNQHQFASHAGPAFDYVNPADVLKRTSPSPAGGQRKKAKITYPYEDDDDSGDYNPANDTY